jgi:hypothetical protein
VILAENATQHPWLKMPLAWNFPVCPKHPVSMIITRIPLKETSLPKASGVDHYYQNTIEGGQSAQSVWCRPLLPGDWVCPKRRVSTIITRIPLKETSLPKASSVGNYYHNTKRRVSTIITRIPLKETSLPKASGVDHYYHNTIEGDQSAQSVRCRPLLPEGDRSAQSVGCRPLPEYH